MKASPDWNEIKQKIYEEDKERIDSWVSTELSTWKNGDFYESGIFAGKIEDDFVTKA